MKNHLQYLPVFAFILLVTIQNSSAQSEVFGIVAEKGADPIPFANVLLLQSNDSTLVKGEVTDIDGNFRIRNVMAGNYLLAATNLGYETQYSQPFNVTEDKTQIDKGLIYIKEATANLDAITVKAKKPLYEQKIDRLVVNVSNSIASAGGTALEVLERSPGVIVNKQWNMISMGGKDGVVVMINGKISRMPSTAIVQMLDGMSADNIEKIELIHTPPANFEAEGNAGILHIVLKASSSEGLNGTYSVNAGYGMKEKAGANLNFNYRKKRLNLFGDYAFTYNNNPQRFENYRSFDRGNDFLETIGSSDRDPTRTYTNQARLGFDYQVTDKTIFGILAGWSDRYWKMDAENEVEKRINGETTEILKVPNDEINRWKHILGNINLQHSFTEDKVLNVDFDYAFYDFTNPNNYKFQYYNSQGTLLNEDAQRVDKETPMGILVGKIDYSQNLNENIIWESGMKGTRTRFDNDILVENQINGEWIANPLFSADYTMEEDIAAVYSSFTIKLNESSNLKAGLRYEYTRANLGTLVEPDIVDRKYGNFFPSVFYTKNFDDNNQFQASYSRRINRPNFNQLAPFFIFYDPTTIETGNPGLQPSITNAAMLNYRWKVVQFSAQYSYENDVIAEFQPSIDIDNDIQVNGSANLESMQVAAATLSFPIQLTKWWEMRNNITAQWQKIKDDTEGNNLEFERKSWYYNGSMNFTLAHGFSAELSGYYFSKALYGALDSHPFGELNVGVQKELPNNNGTLKLNVTDILFTGNWTGTILLPENNFYYKGYYQFSERTFRLTYSRNFGNSKLKEARSRSTGSEEERNRVN